MISFENISMLFKIQILETENFTIEQKKELIEICEKIDKIKTGTKHAVSSIVEYKKLEKELLEKFEIYGGDCEKLNRKIREFEITSIPCIDGFKKSYQGWISKIKKLKLVSIEKEK